MELEKSLVLCCSQTELQNEDRSKIGEILGETLDWRLVKRVAGRNGLLPLVAHTLTQDFSSALPAEEADFLSRYLTVHTAANLRLTYRMIEVVEAFESEGIDVLPFKGPSLAVQLYGNLAFRDFIDLDMLVKPKDFERSVEILLAMGYTLIADQVEGKNGHLKVRGRKDVSLVSPEGDYRVELHWKLSGSHFALPYEIEELWQRMGKIEIGGRAIRALGWNDLMVYLCLHGSRHQWEKFAWVTDVNELIRHFDKVGIDWESVRKQAVEARCERILDLGFFLADYFYGTALNSNDSLDARTREVFTRIATEVETTDFGENFESTELADWYVYHLSLKENVSDRLKLHLHYLARYVRLITRPGDLDKATFRLPSFLYPLYYLLRPVRLLLSYSRRKGGEYQGR
ncbi:MAG: nucleotidyltransferase family protein [Acidobacteriota bacterium]|nr:MAG: nucleotidyltransferase family protein [Acidobacteriota bacterium]